MEESQIKEIFSSPGGKDPFRLPGIPEAKIAAKIAIAAILGWSIGNWFSHITSRPDSLVSGLWCTLTAIVVLQTYLGGTYRASWIRISGIILGSILGALVTILLGANPLSLGVGIFSTAVLCFLFNIKDSIRISCMSLTVVIILWGLKPSVSPWAFAFFRALDAFLGILIAMAVAHLLWPLRAAEKLCNNMSQVLDSFRQLFAIKTLHREATPAAEDRFQEMKHETDDLLQEEQQFLDETRIELWSHPEKVEKFVFLNDRLIHMRKLAATIGKVYPSALKIIDDELKSELSNMMAQIDESLHALSQALRYQKPLAPLTPLASEQEKLMQELLRFRTTRTTRKFDLVEVEGFHVFFYSLNAFTKSILRSAEAIRHLDSEETLIN